MRRFIDNFIPKSYVAFCILGFLLFDRIFHLIEFRLEGIATTGIILVIFFFRRKRRLFSFFLGILLYFAYFTAMQKIPRIEPETFSLIQLEKLRSAKIPATVKLKSEIRKNYWRSEISIQGEAKEVIVGLRNWRENFIPTFVCSSDILKIKTIQNNFGDYFQFLEKYGNYYIQFPKQKCEVVEKQPDVRRNIKNYIEALLARGGMEDYSLEISLGLIFGDSSYLDREFKLKAKEGGILHLFAASGLHIGIFTGFIYLLLSRLSCINYYALKILPTFASFAYLYLLDFPVSLTRAFCFISILTLASLFFRKTHPTDVILYSGSIIFLFDRESYLGLSFNLSFSAVMGIFYFKNALDDILFHRFRSSFCDNLTISLSATIGTFPVLMAYFHSFSFGSILVNYILVPLTSFILPVLYIAVFIELTGTPYLNQIVWPYADLLIRVQALLSDTLSELVGYYREFDDFGFLHLVLFALLLGILGICVFLFSRLEAKEGETNSSPAWQKLKKARWKYFLLSGFFALSTLGFFFAGYNTSPKAHRNSEFVRVESDAFLIYSGNKLHIGGNCKYSYHKLRKIFQDKICKEKISEIFVEKESCLALIKSCEAKFLPGTIQFGDESILSWKDSFSSIALENKSATMRFQLKDSSIVFFRPDKDSLNFLIRATKDGFGKIVLIFPYKSKDNINDWKINQRVLGINENWKFISPSEL